MITPGAADRPVAVVTGASSGIGAATARALAAAGVRVQGISGWVGLGHRDERHPIGDAEVGRGEDAVRVAELVRGRTAARSRCSHTHRSPPGKAASPPLLVPVTTWLRYAPSRADGSMTSRPSRVGRIRMEVDGDPQPRVDRRVGRQPRHVAQRTPVHRIHLTAAVRG